MQIGKAFYCDGCGVNISNGTHCKECNPAQGSEPVVLTFTAIAPDEGTPLHIVNQQQQHEPPRGFLARLLGK